jgi:2-dehydropantoate 2-reductase
MKIAVMGTGGVGGYFGGRLAQAGHDLTFIARGAHLDALRANGLRVDSTAGDFTVSPVRATSDPADVGAVDAVIVAVKSWQLPAAAAALRPLIGEDTVVLPLLNGVEAADVLAEALGPGRTLGGLCRILAAIEAPGHIRHAGMEPSVVLGELDGSTSERARRLHAAFVDAGVRATLADDVQAAIWEKFMLIATWSGIGAVTRAPVGVWRALPGTRALAEAALGEVRMLAHARGVALPDATVHRTLEFIDGVPAGGVASMQRDIMEGRPSELEAQSGAVVRLASEAGVSVPTHAFLYHALLPQERTARGQT